MSKESEMFRMDKILKKAQKKYDKKEQLGKNKFNPKDDFKKQEEEEAKLYPEINQGLEILNEAGEWVLGRKKEQFIAYPMGFIYSGIIGELNNAAVKILNVIAGFTNRFRNTTITNKMIIKYANMPKSSLHNALKELKFYHLISIHYLPGGSYKKRKRCINLSRWDSARDLLLKEKKIKVGLDLKIIFVINNPHKKK